MEFKGVGASPGTVSGTVIVLRHEANAEEEGQNLTSEEAMRRFYCGRSILYEELLSTARKAKDKIGADNAGLFEAYAEILMDDEIEESVRSYIKDGVSPGSAARRAFEDQVKELEAVQSDYMRERSQDLADMGRRLAAAVSEKKNTPLPEIKTPSVLIADDLGPFEIVNLAHNYILGLATDKGGYTGHLAILARSLGIPCVVGLESVSSRIKNNDICALDGGSGLFIIEPDSETIKQFSEKEAARQTELARLAKASAGPVCTKDGLPIMVCANIGAPVEAARARDQGADGIGVFRTELMYMEEDRLPGEEEQFRSYREALTALGGSVLTIRTLDIGGDKEHPALGLEKEENPFLGYRAIRMGLDKPEILKPQIRAILRAAAFGSIELMFPMISSLDELRQARSCVEECRRELALEGLEAGDPPVGIMVETPAAAVMAREFAAEADFFSIGTNDLTQYTLAADRENRRIAKLYDQLDPSVLRLLALTSEAAAEAEITSCVCGEIAADPKALPILIGLGITKFSVSTSHIPGLKAEIRKLDSIKCGLHARNALALSTAAEVRNLQYSS